jgi:hypothetical protein
MDEKRTCFYVNEKFKGADGNYYLVMITEGEQGYGPLCDMAAMICIRHRKLWRS